MKKMRLTILGVLIFAFVKCASVKVKTDEFDGSKIIEYSFYSLAKGDTSALHYLDSRFQKKLKGGKEIHSKLYVEVAGAVGNSQVDPKVTFRIDGQDTTLDVSNAASKDMKLIKMDSSGSAQGAGASFTSSGEIDLASIKTQLMNAKTALIRFQRQGVSAVFEYKESELENIKNVLGHSGEE